MVHVAIAHLAEVKVFVRWLSSIGDLLIVQDNLQKDTAVFFLILQNFESFDKLSNICGKLPTFSVIL